jgi:hypothetical protein
MFIEFIDCRIPRAVLLAVHICYKNFIDKCARIIIILAGS